MVNNKYVHIYSDYTTEIHYEEEYREPEECLACGDFDVYIGEFCFDYKEDIKEFLEKADNYFPEYLMSKLTEWGVDREKIIESIEEIIKESKEKVRYYTRMLRQEYYIGEN